MQFLWVILKLWQLQHRDIFSRRTYIEFPFSISWGVLSSQPLAAVSICHLFLINPCLSLLRNQHLFHTFTFSDVCKQNVLTLWTNTFLVTNHRMSVIYTLEPTGQVSSRPETLSMKHFLVSTPSCLRVLRLLHGSRECFVRNVYCCSQLWMLLWQQCVFAFIFIYLMKIN